MRIIKLNFLLVNIICSTCITIAQWTWQNPLPQGNELTDIAVIDENNLIAIGEFGTILRSSNSGISWEFINSPTSEYLNSISFPGPSKGYIVGSKGTILTSSDGGYSWIKKNNYFGVNNLTQVFFINEHVGWIVGHNNTLIHTTDGLDSWHFQQVPGYESMDNVFFLTENIGWGINISGDLLFKTSDGGETWDTLAEFPWKNLTSLCFINQYEGWLTSGYGDIFKTSDGGNNWQQIEVSDNSLWRISMTDSYIGCVIGLGGEILMTSDGGLNWWQVVDFNHFFRSLRVKNEYAYIVGFYGVILSSNDDFQNWEYLSIGSNCGAITEIAFPTDNIGFAVSTGGYLFKTTDGGENWNHEKISSDFSLRSMDFIDENTGYIAADDGIVLKTINCGENWEILPTIVTSTLLSVHCINKDTGWVAGYHGHILKTVDGGINWKIQYEVPNQCFEFHSVFFLNENKGWASGDNAILVKTENGGDTWELIETTWDCCFSDIYFIDEFTGWMDGGQYGQVLKTKDGGETWESGITHVGNIDYAVWDLFMIDNLTGVAVGIDGLLIHTFDGGENWYPIETNTKNSLRSVFFKDKNTGWVAGNSGTIIKISDEGLLGVTKNISSNLDSKAFNYPNPFSDFTVIHFTAPETEMINIDLYDLNGQFIRRIFAGQSHTGENQILLDKGLMKPGIYIYTINSNAHKLTGKVILTK
jgi:photosystem II stability/assembly factor-like uncharacterized protein